MSVEQAVTPEVVESEAENSGPPIELYCKECGLPFEGKPRRMKDGTWELGPCPAKAGRGKKCGTVNVYLPDTGSTVTKKYIEAGRKNSLALRREALAPFDENRPYNRELLWFEVEALECINVASRVESGKRLIVLRENEGHGNFCDQLDGRGIPRSTAYDRMRLAKTISKFPTVGNLKTLKAAYALSKLDDETLQEIEDTGQLPGGEPLAYLDKCTKAEIAEKLEKLEKDLTKRDKALAKGEEQLKELRKKLAEKDETEIDRICSRLIAAMEEAAWLKVPDEEENKVARYYRLIESKMTSVKANLDQYTYRSWDGKTEWPFRIKIEGEDK